jgi:hypothetical protein
MGKKLEPAQTQREWWAILKSNDKTFIRTMEDWNKAIANPKSNPLKGCDPKAITHFTKNLKFINGGLGHANYSEIVEQLSYMQFQNLWNKFGLSMGLFEDQKDSACTGIHKCSASAGDICTGNC